MSEHLNNRTEEEKDQVNATELTPQEARAAWLAERRKGIGGSDAAAAIGLSPYKTPYELYLEKRGEAPEDDLSGNQFVEWGCRLEDVVADAFSDKTGLKVHRVNRILKSAEHPHMLASLDRRVVGLPEGLEVKTANAWAARDEETWGPTGTDQVPAHYLIQCTHYMAVTGHVRFHLAALMGGNDFRIYTIERNEELIATLIEREAEFWRCVQEGKPPASVTMGDVRRKFGQHLAATSIEADQYITEVLEEYVALGEQLKAAKALEKRKEDLQVILGEYMGENEVLTVGGTGRISFKTQSTGLRLPASLKETEPIFFAAHAVEGTTRVMRLMAEKKKK